ncbi:MAG: HIT family protein [Gammaproteobacteria bacterium]|nr:HIT family protein [Gammaproteobacteria bacterium]MCP5197978.1 HIT family protein [Gammaproteobacteria bacterium]
MSESANCIFCKIVRGEIPSIKIHEDAQTLSFMDVRPASPGHTLVISKAHTPNLLEIAEADLLAVTVVVQRVAQAIQKALAPDGMRVSQFNGAAAGQTVFHYHVHIIPTQEGQRIGAHGRDQADAQQLESLAAQIRAALGS